MRAEQCRRSASRAPPPRTVRRGSPDGRTGRAHLNCRHSRWCAPVAPAASCSWPLPPPAAAAAIGLRPGPACLWLATPQLCRTRSSAGGACLARLALRARLGRRAARSRGAAAIPPRAHARSRLALSDRAGYRVARLRAAGPAGAGPWALHRARCAPCGSAPATQHTHPHLRGVGGEDARAAGRGDRPRCFDPSLPRPLLLALGRTVFVATSCQKVGP